METCEWCQAAFTPLSSGQKYCSKPHARAAKVQRRTSGETVQRQSLGERQCEYCESTFIPSDSAQMYCTKTHQANAAKQRRRLRNNGCPRPEKRAHESRAFAELHVKALQDVGPERYNAYLCACGQWHVGHVPAWADAKVS